MSAAALTALLARCRVLCRSRSQAADAELLRRFAQQRDAAAFEELLERHAALVWGVCRRILPNEADCEDAFQATFLALVRQADAVDAGPSLGAWLHTVALRVARKALARSRRQHLQAFVPEPTTASDVADEVGSHELFRMVDEEIERLPVLLRLPLLLCCLQGRTRDEAAETLGCSVAAVKSRLERGRDLLRRRLERRGVQLPAAFLVLGLTTERIRAVLWAKTMQSALYTPASAVVALAEAGAPAVTMGKGKLFLLALLLVSSAAGAAGSLLTEKPAEAPALPQAKSAAEPKKAEAPQVVRTTAHVDLAKIERKIAKEPAYQSKPKYCLLVLGPEARTRVWLVQDGDTLYVDRNGNGDLTEPDEKVMAEKRKDPDPDDRNYSFAAGELHEGGKRHLNLSVLIGDLNRALAEAKAVLERDPKAKDYRVGLEVERPGHQGLGAGGRLVQGAGSDAHGLLQFADRPQDAPIIHFGGPWTMGLWRPTTLWLDRANNMDLIFGTPGLGAGGFAYVGYEGVVPDHLAPSVEIAFPPRDPGGKPVIASYDSTDRC